MEAPKEYSESDVLRILRNTPGITVFDREKVDFPDTVDLDDFVSEYPNKTEHVRDEIRETAEACRDFLSGIIITDEFKDHKQRREWRHTMFSKYGKAFERAYESNKLRVNNIASLHLWAITLAKALRIYKVHSPRADELISVLSRFPDLKEYEDTKTVEEKLVFVREVDDVCRAFLRALSGEGD